MTKHTPAPWTAKQSPHTSHPVYLINGPTGALGEIRGNIADAKLIADAPHLLEQIRWMVEAYSRWQTDDDPVSRDDWAMSLRAARQWLADHE
jgi:hypothetical protein